MSKGELTEEQALNGATYEFDLNSEGKLTLYYPVYKPVREAIEVTAKTLSRYRISSKDTPAFLGGDIIGQYEILERTDVKSHKNRKFRVRCTKCGAVMFRYTNKMRVPHKDCVEAPAPREEK